MSMQLTLDLTSGPQREETSVIQNEAWLDVSDIARGVSFTTTAWVGMHLGEQPKVETK